MLKKINVNEGNGKYSIILDVTLTSDGMAVQLFGGEKPHVGAMVLSVPRASLADKKQLSCNSIVVPLLGHKDDEVAKPIAEQLACYYGQPVSVTAGIHIDNATPGDIEILRVNCRKAVEKLLEQLNKSSVEFC